ncbi:dephospho-CoA kinase [Malonomonas rubra DSM 5091]|uniref:Dephospho-CoA kinase n=1 Tax=Malonomonas rubra DSM 5091 TaxID=1122189 RepID=A0A1M6I9L5_MALRU|nr:dephospho-CoA kinase [Malonomonas rubra]SHJ31083.1 dephospho-CoA kinase [Malonomonas rubra DSM 5091]
MPREKLILGITGNIASGKSTVAKMFAERGALLIDADQLAREIVEPGQPALQQLVERFGTDILRADKSLDRDKLAQIIFADEQARLDLNQITHPAIGKLAVERLQQGKRLADVPLVVYEAPLLFEAKAENRVDKVLVVKVDLQVQLQRLMQRDGIDEAAAQQRVSAQMPQDEKLARADYVVDNSGSLEELFIQVEQLWQKLVIV